MRQYRLSAVILAVVFSQFGAFSQKFPDLGVAQATTPSPPKNATYCVTMSSTIRPGQPLEIKVQILAGKDPVLITVKLVDYTGNKTLVPSKSTSVSPGEFQSIILDIPENIKEISGEEYLYNLKALVTGVGASVNFKEEAQLTFNEKSFSVFVQTDKAMYKAGQTVKFRILAMTPDMKVIRDNVYDIIIQDSKGNKIRQWLGIKDPNERGVLELSLQLAKQVTIGDWQIEVNTKGQNTVKLFTVDNYVLPKFEVQITAPPFGVSYDPFLPIKVKAVYTFGKPVTKGTAVVKIQYSYYYQAATQAELRFTGQINKDGEFSVQVSSKQLLDLAKKSVTYELSTINWALFKITANVTEADTGKVQQATQDIQFYSNPLKLNFLEISPSNFKPGVLYTAYLEAVKQDSTLFSPAEASKIRIQFNVTYTVKLSAEELAKIKNESDIQDANSQNFTKMRVPSFYYPYEQTKTLVLTITDPIKTVPENGLIPISINMPPNAESVVIEAKGLEPFDEVSTSKYVNKMTSPTGTYLQLKVPTDRPKVGSTLLIKAEANVVLKKVQFQVYSKGKLLLSQTVTASPNAMSVDYSINVAQSMVPKLNIIAFFVKEENSEFVVDAVSLSVDGLFQKPVTIEFSKTKVKPGENVDVIIKAEQDSMVYLLAVDKSVKLLKSGNDLTQEVVQNAMLEYDYGGFFRMWRYMFICGWPSFFSGSDAHSIFQNAGVQVLTDGLVYNSPNDGFPILYAAGPELNTDRSDNKGGAMFTPAENVRKFFPETWLFEVSYITPDSQGQVIIPAVAPDTITTFIASVFSAHPDYGLSVAKEPANLTIFRDLFVNLDLPMSIIRNEDFCFTTSVFSYYKDEIPVLLTLDKSDDFQNIHVTIENGQAILTKESLHYSYFLGYLAENDVVSSKFCFTPTTIGEIPVRVSALSNVQGLSDAMEQIITVKPEGVPRTTSYPNLIDLSSGIWEKSIPISFPSSAVKDSESLTFTTAGNLLGPMFDNLNDLLQKPYGCGEQNMLNFAPNIFLLEFFYSINITSDKDSTRAKDNMLIGYQQEIKYEHSATGGFSAFGNQNGNADLPSLWLSAFVVKCFAIAHQLDAAHGNVITIDKNIITRSVLWMISQQNVNGSFTERGKVFHKEMQGGSAEGEALTAYTVIALYEASKVYAANEAVAKNISDSVKLAVAFLVKRLTEINDPFDICIVTYTLNLVNDASKDRAFQKMESIAITGDGLKYWKRANQVESNLQKYQWSASADSISIEMTSYALQTYTMRGIAYPDGLSIIRWLTNQKGPNGGFISTQDTVIGLQALAGVAAKIYSKEDIPMTLTVTYNSNGQNYIEIIKINKTNEMLLQSVYLNYQNGEPKVVTISAKTDNGRKGPSTVIAELVLGYNVLDETKVQVYDMTHTIQEYDNRFELDIFLKTVQYDYSSMTILEVDIPPGYAPDIDILTDNKQISLVEVIGDKLVLYFNTDVITTKGVAVRILMVSTGGALIKSQPRMYRVSDYYNPGRELTKNYVLKDSSSDFCAKAQVPICETRA